MEALTDVGLGLAYDDLRLERTTAAWVRVGVELRDDVASLLGGQVEAVEQIGSASVVGLLAKPIIDLCVGPGVEHDRDAVTFGLEEAGWIYRGDAGDEGGHIFVLEARPWFRVAHIHVVRYQDPQWQRWVRFRDLMRRSDEARLRYESVKVRLVNELGTDRRAYTDAKSDIVRTLLDEQRR